MELDKGGHTTLKTTFSSVTTQQVGMHTVRINNSNPTLLTITALSVSVVIINIQIYYLFQFTVYKCRKGYRQT